MFIDFIGNDNYLRMLGQHSGQSGQLFLAIYRTGRVGRRTKNQSFGLRRNGGFQLGGGNLEVLLDTCCNNHRIAFRQLHHFRIAHPIRCRHNHFITRVHQYQDCIANRLLGSVGTRNLCSRIFQTVLFFQFLYDSITQGRIPRNGRIAREVIVYRLFGSLFNVVGSIKIRFSDTQVNYIYALSFQLCAFLRHSQRRRGRQAVQTI